MTNAEEKLAQIFAADLPQASDRAFVFSVLERIERRRTWAEFLDASLLVIGATTVLWLAAPLFDALVQDSFALLSPAAFAAPFVIVLTGLALLAYRKGPWAFVL